MANERHTQQREWEVDSSTRQSVHPYTKYAPFRAATSTTASTLKTVAEGAVAVNLVTNPRIESTDVTMYTAAGSAVARDTGQQSAGTASLLVNPANSAAGEGFYWTSPAIPFSTDVQHITAQCEHRGASVSGNATIEIRDADGSTILASSADDNLAASWRRITTTYAVPAQTNSASYRIYITTGTQHNINFYVDKIMVEVRTDSLAVSDYVDGASGTLYQWTGTANASTSIKRSDMSVIRGIKITNESGTSAEIVYVAFDTTATATTGIPVLAGATLETNWPIDFRTNISILAASGTPTVSGVIWGISGY